MLLLAVLSLKTKTKQTEKPQMPSKSWLLQISGFNVDLLLLQKYITVCGIVHERNIPEAGQERVLDVLPGAAPPHGS